MKKKTTPTDEFQKLSCREGGQFDTKFHILTAGADGKMKITRQITCGWTLVCKRRQLQGISRAARIAAKGHHNASAATA